VWSLKCIQVPELWRLGLTGERIRVGVVGTGIDLAHPDFRNNTINAFSLVGSHVADTVGHETGIVWLITRIAPRADIIVAKDRIGAYGYMHHVIDACERLRELGIQILNLSVATDFPTDGTDPVSREVNYLAENGVAVVTAAGNKGPNFQTIGAPGAAELAVTVGKTNERDQVAWDSSRGPTLDGRLKPDCVAPGVRIMAASPVALGRSAYHVFDCTSYAVPHVTGTLVLLKQAYPDVSAADLKRAIMAGCEPAKTSFLSRTAGGSSLRKRLATKVRTALTRQADPRWNVGSGRINALRSHELLRDERNKQTGAT
jgi:subtilisin family serine protease